ncbi:hypothetical protein [Helicobacter sp. NHP22-001]|uniref:hypothetical protein n=1 Tax=Helicobacter sp. NHP22-001 TaxID=3040202 RepID=UPI00244D96D5|nr:hypothetical protein [Helicobacter sp. NHP22-001]GMB95514.1 hypothetical protein NHP22001_01030 [Helicobacter sp. NHP22-001]
MDLPAHLHEVVQTLPKNARIPDFGCGFGQFLSALKWVGVNGDFELLGLDINERAVAHV